MKKDIRIQLKVVKKKDYNNVYKNIVKKEKNEIQI